MAEPAPENAPIAHVVLEHSIRLNAAMQSLRDLHAKVNSRSKDFDASLAKIDERLATIEAEWRGLIEFGKQTVQNATVAIATRFEERIARLEKRGGELLHETDGIVSVRLGKLEYQTGAIEARIWTLEEQAKRNQHSIERLANDRASKAFAAYQWNSDRVIAVEGDDPEKYRFQIGGFYVSAAAKPMRFFRAKQGGFIVQDLAPSANALAFEEVHFFEATKR